MLFHPTSYCISLSFHISILYTFHRKLASWMKRERVRVTNAWGKSLSRPPFSQTLSSVSPLLFSPSFLSNVPESSAPQLQECLHCALGSGGVGWVGRGGAGGGAVGGSQRTHRFSHLLLKYECLISLHVLIFPCISKGTKSYDQFIDFEMGFIKITLLDQKGPPSAGAFFQLWNFAI